MSYQNVVRPLMQFLSFFEFPRILENTGEWISETLTKSECKYLADNIKEWSWGTKWQPQSICVIKKGVRDNG